MPLTKNAIAIQAERYGFTIVGFAPGPGTRADIALKDERSGQSIEIGVWPEYSEVALVRLLSMASAELGGTDAPTVSPDAWLS